MTEPVVFKFEGRRQAGLSIIAALKAAIEHAIATKGFANIALSGGSTPEPIYTELAKEIIDWSKVTIALVDERWVDVDNNGSNEAMLHRAFKNAKGAKIIGMKTDAPDYVKGAMGIETLYEILRPFDAIVMGMGNDAHTASWFMGANHLDEVLSLDCSKTIAAIDASHSEVGKAFPHRLTLTLPPIAECAMVLLLIFGDDKLEVLERSVTGEGSSPIAILSQRATHGLVAFWAK